MKMNFNIRWTLSVVWLFVLNTSLFAQKNLGEAQVVASRGENFTQQFDSTQISRQGLTSVTDILRHFTGVNLRDYGGVGGLKTVSVQGLDASHTTLIINGLAMDNGFSGQVDFSRYAIADVNRISLSVGGSDSLLRPVRTMTAVAVELEMKPTKNSLFLHKTSWEGWETGAQGVFDISKVHFGVSGHFLHAANDYPFTLENGSETLHERRQHSQVNQADFNVAVKWQDVDFQAFYNRSDRQLPGPVTYYSAKGTEQLDEQSVLTQIRYEKSFFPDWTTFAAAKFQFQEQRYRDFDAQYPDGLLDQHYWQREFYATLGAQKRWQNVKLALVSDLTYNSLTHNLLTSNPHRLTSQTALSFQAQIKSFTFTARALGHYINNDCASDFGRVTSEFAVKWLSKTNVNFRLYYKSHFRAPTFSENYYHHLGSADLKPELTRQAGLSFAGGRGVAQWQATAYYSHINDRITGVPYNLFLWRMENVGHVDNVGAELRNHTHFGVKKSRFDLYFNYSFLYSRYEGMTQLPYTPRHSGSFALCWSLGTWRAAVNGTVTGQRWATLEHTDGTRLKTFAECNISAGKMLIFKKLKLNIELHVNNVFNTRYEIVRRYPMEGVNYGVKVEIINNK